MFRVDLKSNRLTPLNKELFADLKFREREHLQEWLAYRPEALGEKLLIIQKEFDGFQDTRERLDLLALDKAGQLVIIENKLDDSGRDVTWQALKYAAYASSLTKAQIVEIFQDYLDKYDLGKNASEEISEFLGPLPLAETTLNPGNSQRLIFIAANFRKEVTATVLWLISQGIEVQCFKVTPYSMGEDTLIDVLQIIPTPEASDLMISMAKKETAERQEEKQTKIVEVMRREYWGLLLETLRGTGDKIFQNISAGKDHWLNATAGVRLASFEFILLKSGIRVSMTISGGTQEENKWFYAQLKTKIVEIEQSFENELIWLLLPEKRSSRLQFEMKCNGYEKERWPEYIDWHVKQMAKLSSSLQPHIAVVDSEMKNGR